MASMEGEKFRTDLNEFLTLVNIQFTDKKDCLQAFRSFVKSQEQCLSQWKEKERDYQNQLKNLSKDKEKQIKTLTKDRDNLETKLKLARRMIDEEKLQRKRAEEDRFYMEQQLQVIRNLLQDNRNKLHDETREKLQYLSTIDQRLNTINETFNGTTGSCLSDLSYSRSEDDLDVELMRNRRFRKSRAFTLDDNNVSPKRRRSSITVGRSDTIKARPGECLVATTRVDMGTGIPCASSVIETFPSSASIIAPLDPVKPTAPQLSTDSGESEFDENQIKINNCQKNDFARVDHGMQSPNGFFNIGFGNSSSHALINKTIIRPEMCDPCGKKIRFGRVALKCPDCRTICHVECKDKLKLPCIPFGPGPTTPTAKLTGGTVADYAPSTSPMIPAIVVHCINEIELRGLNEIGLYRMAGSKKEVKFLKDKFLRGKCVPNLSHVDDIHVVTGCLKDFFQHLQEPLGTYTQWQRFVNAIEKNTDQETRRAELYQVFTKLPQPNRDTLAFLILHLQRVAEAHECHMPLSSLALIFGPTVIGYSRPDIEKLKLKVYEETDQANAVMVELLNIPTEYWENSLTRSAPPMPCTPSSSSIRCGFLDSPRTPGWVTIRKKKPN